MSQKEVVIVAYGRSAVAKSGKKGYLRLQHPVDYAAKVLEGVLDRVPNLPKSEIYDVIVGTAKPEAEQGNNVARLIALRAGLPYSVSAQTINRFCSSGLQSISTAANMIWAGEADVVVAGGVESMSKLPMAGNPATRDQWINDNEPGLYMPMGITAENVAEKYGVSREAMDAFAVESHHRAEAAQKAGKFDDEIIPVTGNDLEGNEFEFKADQGIRYGSTMEALGALKPVFKEDGSVTAGQASQTSDGAGFVVLMSREKAESLNIKPVARFLGFNVAGVDPTIMGIGPIEAIPRLLSRLDIDKDDIDVIELNEAFAAQAIPIIDTLGLDKAKVNPNGGAIALGHPLGATGAILTAKIINELKRIKGRYGLVTMCIGGGMGAAGLIELLED
ncbi:TPA: acetyl-CoA C-acyltransferase [Streptococcus suis]